jgi:hypothetical protein
VIGKQHGPVEFQFRAGNLKPAQGSICGMTVRRLKTYAGAQGYVYQYYFVGKRAAGIIRSPTEHLPNESDEKSADEYIFDVTSDRQSTHAVSILLPRRVVSGWAEMHGRALSDAEQYAAVKMRLFRVFDQEKDAKGAVTVDSAFIEEALVELGVD